MSTASACALEIREYPDLLRGDDRLARQAERIRDCSGELGAFIARELAASSRASADAPHLAFQAPCTLQHGLQSAGNVEKLLRELGFRVSEPAEAHLCCGSAGTYSISQPQLSRKLRERKLANLMAAQPEQIATANIGCMLHLREASELPVRHWIELVDEYTETND